MILLPILIAKKQSLLIKCINFDESIGMVGRVRVKLVIIYAQNLSVLTKRSVVDEKLNQLNF